MNNPFSALPQANPLELRKRITAIRQEILLAKEKRAGIDAAIKTRETCLARLEAQLVLTGPALAAPSMVASR